ncbi:MFS transporter [Priestia koreensis]|uniref:MFS transporter n=1 Tax=Priestia koreensis TaxID=284581 RepID=UPI00203CA0DE|nr:MFS transporter [Priestia koreensis]MCM3005884.1 MFS transporter [Priestia koreensis]
MNLIRNKNFNSIIIIGLINNIGDSLFFIVTMWYVANNSNVSIYAGLAVFLFTLPETLLIFIGPLIDRVNPKKILMLSTCGQIIIHTILIVLFLGDIVNIPVLLILLLFSAICSSITYPVEETILPQIVEGKDLVKANSVFTVAYKLSNSLFDGVAGILLVVGSASLIYQINLVIFILPLFLIRLIKYNLQTEEFEKFNFSVYSQELKEGLSFILNSNIKIMLIPLALLNFFTSINLVALPFFSNSLSESASTYGFLLASSGVGSMLGAVIVNKIEKYVLPGKILTFGLFFNGVLWILMTISKVDYLAFFFMFLASLCLGGYNIIFTSLFQAMTPIKLLGRVNTSIDSVITLAMPIGALVGGIIIDIFPLKLVMLLYALALIVTGFIYFKNNNILTLGKIETIQASNDNEFTQ